MPKNYKDMIDELINKMGEDAPANSAGGGGVAGIGVGPDGEPGVNKKDKKDPLLFGKYKTFKKKLKENSDNNNIMLTQILDTIDKVEVKIDNKNGIKTEIVVEEEKQYKSFKEKYNA
jgi:hypothetical protein